MDEEKDGHLNRSPIHSFSSSRADEKKDRESESSDYKESGNAMNVLRITLWLLHRTPLANLHCI